jgi:hypothetical protein
MKSAYLLLLLNVLIGCSSVSQEPLVSQTTAPPRPVEAKAEKNSVPVIHVFVGLCDNVNQGIVPVAPSLGNGDDAPRNLYWGAAFGYKTFFNKSRDWQLVSSQPGPDNAQFIVERIVLKRRDRDVFLVADAYRGSEILRATMNFLQAAAGEPGETISVVVDNKSYSLHLHGGADLVAYAGHDGLMDFQLSTLPKKRDDKARDAIILACASKSYFDKALRVTGATPLLWTTNLMAPEAYILSAAVDGWLNHETDEQIRMRAAKAYDQYQHCGMKSASALFATGW